jgi:5-methylcytosine-specific restriction endonuclease McrA
MESSIKDITIKRLMEIKEDNLLIANPEYQRGFVWTVTQQKKLIDSVLRGYPLPLIYLHIKKVVVKTLDEEAYKEIAKYEIIDGQQRIESLYKYWKGKFKLFDPKGDDSTAHFPNFIKDAPCEWSHCFYADLSDELKEKFNSMKLAYVRIDTDNDDEARDLFIRLQAGTSLNEQEKRDAWPGGYTEFVLKFAGKKNNDKYPGHDFFNNYVKANKRKTDKGGTRQICAGLGMLYFSKATMTGNWTDLDAQYINECYHQNLGLKMDDARVVKFGKLLDLAAECLSGYTGKPLEAHEVYHIILLIEELYDNYAKSWVATFQDALERFRKECARSKKDKSGEYYREYTMYISVRASSSNSLKTRHTFFTKKMLDMLNTVLKDKKRGFGKDEREYLYSIYDRKCQICQKEIAWDDLEIHHVEPHQHGGKTILENGIPVHKQCHPKGKAAEDLAEERNVASS